MKNFARPFLIFLFAFIVMPVSCKKDKPAPPDPCAGVVCENDGTCNNGKCDCLPGWTGERCKTYYTSLYEGKFTSAGFNCGQFPSPITEIDIKADTVNRNKIYLQNNLYAEMSGGGNTNFTIPPQTMVALSIWGEGFFIDTNNVYIKLNIGLPGVGLLASCSGNFSRR